MLWVAMAIASTALWPVYHGPGIVVVIVVGTITGTAIAMTGMLRRWSSVTVMAVTIGMFLLIGVPVAVPALAQFGVLPTVEGLGALVAGVALGWKQLVTISLPVGQYQALLVPALVLVLTTSVVGATIALRARRAEFAVLAPIILFIISTVLGPAYPDRPMDTPIALLVVTLLWLAWLRWEGRRLLVRDHSRLAGAAPSRDAVRDSALVGFRTFVSASLILALASVAAVATATAVPPTADRIVARTAVVQPFDPRDYVSPLAGFRTYWQPGDDPVLMTVSGLPVGSRIRVATMDTFDGVVYSVGGGQSVSESGSFTRVPSTVDQSSLTGVPTTIKVLVGAYSSVWLPTLGKLESVVFAGERAASLTDSFYYNDASGSGAVVSQLRRGDEYSLRSVVPIQPRAGSLGALTPGAAVVPRPRSVPPELSARLDEYTRTVTSPGARLQAMIDGLGRDGYISHGVGTNEPPSRSGHASDRIAQLFTEPRMIGDAEQYAVAAALMAGELGFPARVVFGFVPETAGSGPVEVRNRDASAWIEVSTAQFGWVSLNPTPAARPIPAEQPRETAKVARPATIVTPPVTENQNSDRQPTPETTQDPPADPNGLLEGLLIALRVVGWVGLAIAVVLSPFAAIITAKARRRRLRQRAPTAADRIGGGWRQFEDAVIDHGLSPASSATRSEVAAVAGGPASLALAAVADRSSFAPERPAESEARAVWLTVAQLEAQLDTGTTRWQRMKARVSIRSLGGYRGTDPTRRSGPSGSGKAGA